MNARLATINLQAADPQRSKRFYLDALGLSEDERRSHPPDFVYLRSPGADVTIARPTESSTAEPSPTMELGFEVDDFGAMKGHLETLGVEAREQSMGWGQAMELRDLDGHRVVIYAFPKGRPKGS